MRLAPMDLLGRGKAAHGAWHAHVRKQRRVQPMLRFKSAVNARIILGGIEMVHMMHKGQANYACIANLSLAKQFDLLAV